jgi:SAM-dependent methyltransferase
MDRLSGEMLEIRHVAGGTRRAYNAIYAGAGIRQPDRYWRWLLGLMDLAPGMRLLDVACGEGQLLRLAAARGARVTGVDLSEVALRRARRAAPTARWIAANGEALPLADGTFERVSNIGSLEHYEDPIRGAAEMARVLRPDGLACILVPNSFGLRWNVLYTWRHGDIHDDGQPIQRYGTRRQWERLLAAGGLAVERVVGGEDLSGLPDGPGGWPALLRHPSRLLIPLAAWMPVNMASMLVFLCRKA